MGKPWHVMVVGLLAVLWNGFGAADYVMTQLDVAAWTGQMPEGLKSALAGYPAWMDAVWALAVFCPLLAAFLLLSGHRASALWFGIGFLLFGVAALWNYALSPTPIYEVAGSYIIGVTVAVGVLGLFQWLYARALAKRGILE